MANLPLPDTDIWHCLFCRQYHGEEKFCPSTAWRWTRRFWRRLATRVEAILDGAALFIVYVLLAATILIVILRLGQWLLV